MRKSVGIARLVILSVLLGLVSWSSGLEAQTLTLAEALDATNLVWSTGGDSAWFPETNNSHDGNGAACSGVLAPGQTTWLETTVVGPATLSYWSELTNGTGQPWPPQLIGSGLSFAINPTAGPWPPVNPFQSSWVNSVYDLPVGTNVLRWTFTTFLNATNPTAQGFLDQVLISAPRPLGITAQPQDQSAYSGDVVFLSVGVIGTPPIIYQWLKDGTNLAGATNYFIFFSSATTNDSGVYSVLVTNILGDSVISSNAQLTVLPPTPPIISEQPMDTTVYSGESASLYVFVDGSPPFSYQWLKDGTNIPGAQSYTLSFTNVQASDAGVYSVEVSNSEGGTNSSNAVLTVLASAAPIITSQPCSLNVAAGSAPVLLVAATGTPDPQYQWLRNGTNIPTAHSSSLSFSNIGAGDTGVYSVRVSNVAGAVLSRAAIVTVLPSGSSPGSWWQGVYSVYVTNSLAYLGQSTGVGILDVSNPASPVMLGGCDTASPPLAVSVSGGLLGVAEGFGGLQIVSVTNPFNPVVLGTFSSYDMIQDVAMVGNLAYVAASTAGLQIIDISDPTHPVGLGSFTTNMSAFAVRVVGHYAFVGCPAVISLTNHPMSQGLQIIDVSNPAQPILVGTTSYDAHAVDVLGNIALTVGQNAGLSLFDVGNPAAPVLVGSYYAARHFPPLRTFFAYNDIQAVGNLAYLACGTNGLWVLDVSNPSSPVDVGIFATSGSAQRLAVVGNLAYVALGDGGLQIIELPSNLGVQPSPALWLFRQNGLRLGLNGPAGAQFSVEHTDDLVQGPWQFLQTITLSNAPATLDVPAPGTASHFFRARYLLP